MTGICRLHGIDSPSAQVAHLMASSFCDRYRSGAQANMTDVQASTGFPSLMKGWKRHFDIAVSAASSSAVWPDDRRTIAFFTFPSVLSRKPKLTSPFSPCVSIFLGYFGAAQVSGRMFPGALRFRCADACDSLAIAFVRRKAAVPSATTVFKTHMPICSD